MQCAVISFLLVGSEILFFVVFQAREGQAETTETTSHPQNLSFNLSPVTPKRDNQHTGILH